MTRSVAVIVSKNSISRDFGSTKKTDRGQGIVQQDMGVSENWEYLIMGSL